MHKNPGEADSFLVKGPCYSAVVRCIVTWWLSFPLRLFKNMRSYQI